MPGESILVVDDNEFNTEVVEHILTAAGYVTAAANGAGEAQLLLDKQLPRLILMDLQMPEVDGYELTRRIKQNPRTQHIIVVALTSLPADEGGEEARAAGCAGYITKPVDARVLPQQVEKYLQAGPTGWQLC